MKAEAPTEGQLRKLFCEIAQGSTRGTHQGRDFYVKHLTQVDQYDLEVQKESVYEKAKAKGLPTEKEALEVLIEGDVWSQEEESEIAETTTYLENLRETKRNLIIPSQIENINKDITEAEDKLTKIQIKKSELLTQTCESYAALKNNDYSIYVLLHKDDACTQKLFGWDEFGELSKVALKEWLVSYGEISKHLNIEYIKYLAISPIFSLYYNITGHKNLHSFFQKPVFELTFYQLNLLNYGRVLHSILENIEGIPEQIKKNPDDLLDYAESKRKNKDVVEKSKDKQGFSVMGATQKDMKDMGVSDEAAVSPFELAKKKGALTLEDFQNFS